MRKTRSAFTIVELVIVIAIIAILAGVLIPVFGGVVNKANESVDRQLIRNLNTSLSIAKATDGKNETMYDALKDAEDAGYKVSKINAQKTQNEILWDSVNDWFVYLNVASDETETVEYLPDLDVGTKLQAGDYRLWKISNSIDGNYSTYYTGSGKDITTSKGFDAGETTTVKSVAYTNSNAQPNVTIRTNSYDTVLTVDAENDTVRHFGKAKEIEVKSVSMQSYYEYGDVLGNINLIKGNVIVEQGSKASSIIIDMTAEDLVSVTTVSANNEKANYVPIILKTTKTDWAGNSHKDLIDPTKNNIIYTMPDSTSTVVKEEGQEDADISGAVAYAKNSNKYYMSMDTAINTAPENEYIMVLKGEQTYHALSSEVNPIAKGVTIDLNGNSLKMAYNCWITGENLTIKNGTLKGVTDNQSYSCFFGDEDPTSVTLSNLTCTGGLNFYNTTATVISCDVTLNAGYNAVWADSNSDITIESGTFDNTNRDVGYGVIGCSNSTVNINGGTFLSNNEDYFLSTSEYVKDEYESEATGVYVNGGNFNVNVSDFTFLLMRNSQIVKEFDHVSLLRSGYQCQKVGDVWVVTQK